jgi:type II secretory pathway pseudopilin PulG
MKQGFTLVEVALAVLAVGLGLVTIFALFPAGLQNASDDAADTRAGLFAGTVFSAMRGGAASITATNVWDVEFIEKMAVPGWTLKYDGAQDNIRFPPTASDLPENYIRYTLSISQVANTAGARPVWSATLSTCDGRYGVFSPQNVFYTEFFYTGN